MKKVLSAFIISSVLFLCAAPIFSLAAINPAPVANSSIQRPVPSFRSDGTYDYYKSYVVTYTQNASHQYRIFETIFHVNTGEQVFFALGNYNYSFSSLSSSLVHEQTNVYDALTGNFLESYFSFNTQGPAAGTNSTLRGYYYFSFVPGLAPNNGNFCTDLFLISDNVSIIGTNQNWFSSSDFVSWYIDYSDDVIRSKIPQLLSDLHHMYLADHEHLWQVNIEYPYFYQAVGLVNNTLTAEEFYNQFFVSLNKSDYTHVNLHFVNRSEHSCHVYVSSYDVVSGVYIQTSSLIIPAIDPNVGTDVTYDFPIAVDAADGAGLWYAGFINTDGLDPFEKLKISWSDTIDYTSDFQAINLLIQDAITKLDIGNQTLQTISQLINAIYTTVDSNFSWLKTTYYNTITSKWDISNNYLLSIYNLINESDETVTIYDETSAMNKMESAKNDLIITDANGNHVDAGDAAAVGLSEAASQIGDLAQPVSTINQLIQNIVFDKPKLLLPVIVALGLGLMVTILGKNKSD